MLLQAVRFLYLVFGFVSNIFYDVAIINSILSIVIILIIFIYNTPSSDTKQKRHVEKEIEMIKQHCLTTQMHLKLVVNDDDDDNNNGDDQQKEASKRITKHKTSNTDNNMELHFVIEGPSEEDSFQNVYQGGIYYGVIEIPKTYPNNNNANNCSEQLQIRLITPTGIPPEDYNNNDNNDNDSGSSNTCRTTTTTIRSVLENLYNVMIRTGSDNGRASSNNYEQQFKIQKQRQKYARNSLKYNMTTQPKFIELFGDIYDNRNGNDNDNDNDSWIVVKDDDNATSKGPTTLFTTTTPDSHNKNTSSLRPEGKAIRELHTLSCGHIVDARGYQEAMSSPQKCYECVECNNETFSHVVKTFGKYMFVVILIIIGLSICSDLLSHGFDGDDDDGEWFWELLW